MNKYDKLKLRLLFVDALRQAKRSMPYRELAGETGISESVLARYVTGSMVPGYETAAKLFSRVVKLVDPSREIMVKAMESGGLLDLTPVLTNPFMLKMASLYFYDRFRAHNITKILVPETSGITLATAISLEFGVEMVVARRVKENPLIEYLEEHSIEPPSFTRVFYIPRNSITKWDRILIVDDIVQTGLTLSVMEKLAIKNSAKVIGVAALVVVGEEWRKKVRTQRIEALLKISKI